MGLGDIGDILSCNRDGAFYEGYDPRIELTRTQTIMRSTAIAISAIARAQNRGRSRRAALIRDRWRRPGEEPCGSGWLSSHSWRRSPHSPAPALERVIDISNDRWVEVSGEGSVERRADSPG